MKLLMWTMPSVLAVLLAVLSTDRCADAFPPPPQDDPTVSAAGSASIHTQVNDINSTTYQIQVSVTYANAPQFSKIRCSIKDPNNQVWIYGQLGNNGGTVYSVPGPAGGTVFYLDVAKNSAWGNWIAGDGATVVFACMWDYYLEQVIANSDYYDAYLN